jgi:fructuronate reductase
MISFTVTEKGYALKGSDGEYLPFVKPDLENGPDCAVSAMAVVTAMLYERYKTGAAPLAVVSMDNCSHNGEKLQNAVTTVANEWLSRGFVDKAFVDYISDESKISFPWTMIDKITPRPSTEIADSLEADGIEAMQPIVTARNTYIAPFVNAEGPQYLVVEDKFPNGRPALEKAGVYLTDRKTVNEVERMKVTTCLNPLHTALAVYGCVLGYKSIAAEMKDSELVKLVNGIGPKEGMKVVVNPGILSPEEFVKEVIEQRLPNVFIPDTPQRIACDTSQKVGIRYGETIKSYVERYGSAKELDYIPVAIAGWLRYLMGVDDEGNEFELSPDPMLDQMRAAVADIEFGNPDSIGDKLKPVLSNANIFGMDLYEAGIGEKIEKIFAEEIAGTGAVRDTLRKYV